MNDLNGQTLRGYVLREMIGTGGFAAVYRAFQPVVEREVAIKIILPKYANDPDFVRRFETEAQLIARLEHIHIVPLFDYWREPNNAYLVMRWLRGGSLYTSLRQNGPWELPLAVRLVEQVTAALTVAHRHGVIHQDLTPTNILLDEERNAYLADFGIARDILNKNASVEGATFGSPAYIAPERIKHEAPMPQTDIYSFGLVLYELLTGEAPFAGPTHTTLIVKQLTEPVPPLQLLRPDLPDAFNAIILRSTAKNPADRYPDVISLAKDFRDAAALGEGVAALSAMAGDDRSATGPLQAPATLALAPDTLMLNNSLQPQNPYKGLRAFDEADAADFFGRDALVQQLLKRLAGKDRFLAVVGPSGSGKSSVVRAGLVPALRRGGLPGSDSWFIARMVPGAHPMEDLAAALLSVSFDVSTQLLQDLHASDRALLDTVHRILPSDEAELVLVIDQFEELFTLVEDEVERGRFLNSLRFASTDPDSRLRIIITLRADYYDRPLLYAGFGELMRAHTEVVLPLSTPELRDTIAGPALRAGLLLEEGLIAAIIADVSAQPGGLPLLQYALTELFEQREGQTLTLAAYRKSGGVLDALASRAEELYQTLDSAQQDLTRQLFLRLITLGEGAEDTRRRARWAEVMSLGDNNRDAIQTLMNRFGERRLLTFDRDPQTREPTVEVAHEALIRRWEQLHGWLSENRENLRLQQRLNAATAEWDNAGQHSSYLATGARLVQFEILEQSGILALTNEERAYVKASIALRQRAHRLRQVLGAVLIVLTLVALGFAAFAFDRQSRAVKARDRADQQAAISRSNELSILSVTSLTQVDRALLLSLEALRSADTLEARGSLLTALETAPHLAAFLHGNTSPVRAVAFGPSGQQLASASQDGLIVIWDMAARRPAPPASLLAAGWANSLAFSPDGKTLVSGGSDGLLQIWDIASGAAVGGSLIGHTDAVWSVAYSPDGKIIASGSADGTIRLWDAHTGAPSGDPLEGHTDTVYGVAFSPDGALLASGSGDGTIRLWDVHTGEPHGDPLVGHTYWVRSVAFSPDGALLASGSTDNTIIVWNVETGEPLGLPLQGHEKEVRSVVFTPDGTLLVSGSADGSLRVWDMITGQPALDSLVQHDGAIWGVALSPDGHTAASGGLDARLLLWDIGRAYRWRQDLTGHDEAVLSVAFSPNGSLLASSGGNPAGGAFGNTIRLWDPDTGADLGGLGEQANSVSAIAFSPDGARLASASFDKAVTLWDVASRQPVGAPWVGHASEILSLAYSPTGEIIASGSDDGVLILWDAATGQLLKELTATEDPSSVMSLAFSPDGALLASGHRDFSVVLWDVATCERIGEPLQMHTGPVITLAFSPDGARLASGSRDFTIILWDVAARQPAGPPLAAHKNWVMGLAFSPDGRWLVSGSSDTTLILWDAATGRPIGQPLPGHRDYVSSVAFSPNGHTIASGSWDHSIFVWDINLDTWQNDACVIANRNLDAEEIESYFGGEAPPPTCPKGE